jgi:outer membrane protein W
LTVFRGVWKPLTKRMKLKKLILIAAAAVLTITSARAQHEYNWNMRDRFVYVHEGELFLPNEFSLDAFATYTTTPRNGVDELFTHNLRHGDWGGGLGANYFFTKYVGFGADVIMPANGNQLVDSASGNLILRLPFDAAHVAPYIFGGGGGQFDPNSQWLAQGGVGVDFRINHWTGLFTDVRYVWTEDAGEYGLFRAGLRFAF